MLKTETPLQNLTNQELIQEFQRRFQAKTLEAVVVADEVKETSNSLFALLGAKEWLVLIGLTTLALSAALYSIKATSSKVTSYKIEFDQHPPLTLNTPLPNGDK